MITILINLSRSVNVFLRGLSFVQFICGWLCARGWSDRAGFGRDLFGRNTSWPGGEKTACDDESHPAEGVEFQWLTPE